MHFINQWTFVELERCESTNDEAKKYNSPVVVTAFAQTHGRGRRGRSWIGLEGNLFVSINMAFAPQLLSRMIIRIGLAVCQTIQFFAPQAEVKLKWPNDVLVNNKKVCGILLEKGQDEFWVVGIGVNLCSAPVIEGLVYPATSLKDEGVSCERYIFLQKMITVLDNLLAQDFETVKEIWLLNAKGLHQTIKVKDESFEIEGKFVGIDDDGILLIESENSVKKIMVGDVLYENK